MTYWIGVAVKAHVMVGVEGGFCQLGHGRHAPILRLSPQDWLLYYAPRMHLDGKGKGKVKGNEKVQAFVALGQIQSDDPYQVQVSENFSAWRRNVDYQPTVDAPIHPLLAELEFIDDPRYWGIKFRRSLFEINQHDFEIIARAMGADI